VLNAKYEPSWSPVIEVAWGAIDALSGDFAFALPIKDRCAPPLLRWARSRWA